MALVPRLGVTGRPPARRGAARWILTAPLLTFLTLMVAFPIGYGVWTSLQNRTLLSPSPHFIGLANYASVLTDGDFWASVEFTIYYTVISLVLETVLGVGLALLFDRKFPGKRVLLTCVLLPIMIAPSLMGVMFRLLLNGNIGLVPAALATVGLQVSLFSNTTVVPLLIALDVLQWTPFIFLISYSGLQTMPQELYEAAAVDGAGYWRIVRAVTLPLLKPVLVVAVFLRGIDAFRTFDVIYILTGGGPGVKTMTLSIYIYKKAFQAGDFGAATAASVIVLALLAVVVPYVTRRVVTR